MAIGGKFSHGMTRALFCCFVILITGGIQPRLHADLFTDGNILMTVGNQLREYSRDGDLIQNISVPKYDPNDINRRLGGVVIDAYGNVHVVNDGISRTELSTYDAGLDSWSHTLIPYSGGALWEQDLTILGDYIYYQQARMHVPTRNFTTFNSHFSIGFSDAGRDGRLYSINSGTPRSRLRISDPVTLLQIGPELRLDDSTGTRIFADAIAATSDGRIFAGDDDGIIYEYDSNGNYITEYATAATDIYNIAISSSGDVLLGSRHGPALLTDTSFSSFTTVGFGGYASFVEAPAPVPEPASMTLLICLGCLVTLRRRMK